MLSVADVAILLRSCACDPAFCSALVDVFGLSVALVGDPSASAELLEPCCELTMEELGRLFVLELAPLLFSLLSFAPLSSDSGDGAAALDDDGVVPVVAVDVDGRSLTCACRLLPPPPSCCC